MAVCLFPSCPAWAACLLSLAEAVFAVASAALGRAFFRVVRAAAADAAGSAAGVAGRPFVVRASAVPERASARLFGVPGPAAGAAFPPAVADVARPGDQPAAARWVADRWSCDCSPVGRHSDCCDLDCPDSDWSDSDWPGSDSHLADDSH